MSCRGPRRALLFHIASMLDDNECTLDALPKSADKTTYYKTVGQAVVP